MIGAALGSISQESLGDSSGMLRPPLRRSDLLGRGDHLNLEGVLIRVRTTLKSLVEMSHKTLGQLDAV
ncbi:hypothetical protein D9M69_441060 [compost metagenome]